MRAKWIGLLIGLIVGISGCTPKEAAPAEPKAAEPAPAPAPAEEPAADPVAAASEIFQSRCTVCHGESGKGDGAGSAALQSLGISHPPNGRLRSRTNTFARLSSTAAPPLARLRRCQPNPDLDAKPEVVAELVKYVRDLAK